MKRTIILFFMTMCLLPYISFAGNRPSITLQGKEVSLGDTRSHVKAIYKDYCNVNESDDDIGIFSCETEPRIMGIITFNNGKVTSVMKQWSNHFDNSEVKLTFQSIYDVINGITKNNTVPAKVSTKQANSPDRNQEIITIKMGHRRVAIMSNEEIRFKTKTVEVFEYLE